MGFFSWLTGRKNAPANNRKNMLPAAPAANVAAAPPFGQQPTIGGRRSKHTMKNRKTNRGRKASRKNRKGGW